MIQAQTGAAHFAQVATVGAGATSATIPTGLRQSSSHDVRVYAVNATGKETPSASDAAIAGASLTVYSADQLTGSGNMGTASTGGQMWETTAGEPSPGPLRVRRC